MNVAVVFNKLPKMWEGKQVINGDETDVRIDERTECGDNVIVGLKFKGSKAELEQGIKDGFVVEV